MANDTEHLSPSLAIAYCDYTYRGSPNTDLLLLAASIRRYGGICGSAPVWVMCQDAGKIQAQVFEKVAALHVELLPYRDVQDLTDFPFAQKALAAAEAERRAEGKASELLWFDRDSLVLNDLAPLLPCAEKKVSFRPVNVQNIGQASAGPEDVHNEFWRRACVLGGVDYRSMGTTTSYIDRKVLRFYIAAGLVGIRPELGIFREWERLLRIFAGDRFMRAYCQEHVLYKIFMHQAALSIAVAGKTKVAERQELPPSAMYPMNFWNSDSNAYKPAVLDEVISLRYDTVLDDDGWGNFPMSTGLRNWINDNIR